MGLSLSKEKTRIIHLSDGFDFLSYNVRHYRDYTRPTGVKLLIKPSREAVDSIRVKLRAEWKANCHRSPAIVTEKLNPIIRGWANYHRVNAASRTFDKLDHWMFHREVRYAKRRHPKKPTYWKRSKYWGRLCPGRNDSWVFGDKQKGRFLLKFRWFKIKRHVMVKGESSPDDQNLREYWRKREQAKTRTVPKEKRDLAENQEGLCPVCGESLFNGEETNTHHKEPRGQ